MSILDVLPVEAQGRAEDLPAALRTDASVEAVVRPRTAEEVADVLRWASLERVRVVPIGTGRHLPRVRTQEPCVVLSVAGMAGIELYEPADLTFTAAAGTTLGFLATELARHRQWLPFDPPGADERSLGGLVAAGLGGPLGSGWYGDLRNHVLGATAVFGDGRVVRLGGRVVKNVAGFDLLRPLVGSQGSLAVMTSVCMRVFPVPETDRVLVLRGAALAALADAARTVAAASILPASALLVSGSELLDGAGLVLRLQGARPAVDADQRVFERLVGAACESVEGDAAGHLAGALRDLARDWEGVGILTVLPDRIGPAIAALVRIVGAVPSMMADPLAGRIRFALGAGDVPALDRLRRAVEELDGSLGVERLPRIDGPGRTELAEAVDRAVSVPSAAERTLTERVRSVYDPGGVLGCGAGHAPAAVEASA